MRCKAANLMVFVVGLDVLQLGWQAVQQFCYAELCSLHPCCMCIYAWVDAQCQEANTMYPPVCRKAAGLVAPLASSQLALLHRAGGTGFSSKLRGQLQLAAVRQATCRHTGYIKTGRVLHKRFEAQESLLYSQPANGR